MTDKEQIYECIVELSDLKLQRKLWLNEDNDTGLISSYIELICTLFDDYNFDGFIDNYDTRNGLSQTTILQLRKLRELLNHYIQKEVEDNNAIINDLEWQKIVYFAQQVIKEWDKN